MDKPRKQVTLCVPQPSIKSQPDYLQIVCARNVLARPGTLISIQDISKLMAEGVDVFIKPISRITIQGLGD